MGNTALQAPAQKSPLQEFSVVYTERATNLMASTFREAMQKSLLPTLKEAYQAESAIIVPGSGTFAMEAVARQFALHQPTVIVRNGLFSFRWSAILEMAGTKPAPVVLKATFQGPDNASVWTPCPVETVVKRILADKPKVVFAPHVETATGLLLPHSYIAEMGRACRAVDALFVLDCIASGCVWVDMKALQVDVLISAPQKGWSGPACCGFVMLGERGMARLAASGTSSSFSLDLKQWAAVSDKYSRGEFMYHTTLPTDALMAVASAAVETKAFGFENARFAQQDLGAKVRKMLQASGLQSVAAEGFDAPGVVVVHSPRPDMVARFMAQGFQVAAGVPFKLDEPAATSTFRVGLFGLDKLVNVDGTVARLEAALRASL